MRPRTGYDRETMAKFDDLAAKLHEKTMNVPAS